MLRVLNVTIGPWSMQVQVCTAKVLFVAVL